MQGAIKDATRVLIFVIVLQLFVLPTLAQFAQRGAIAGTSFDSSGAVVAGVQITLTTVGQSATRDVVTDKMGHFEFDNITAGQYQLTATAKGFATAVSQPITVNIGELTHYDFNLTLSSVAETVTVTGESAALQTDQTGVTTNVNSQQLAELPLNGRNFTSLAALAPGIATYPQANINPNGTFSVGAQFAMGGVAFSTGGSFQGSRDTGFYVNGVNIDDNYESSISFQPSAEALGTGKIQVSDFSAAVGNDISAIDMQTKGGTSEFHGEAYDFMENTDLNATNPYNKLVQGITNTPATKPSIIRNQFGGNIGGPVYIPKVLPWFKNRAFFFGNYEKMLEHDGNRLVTASVPSAAERLGDFSELLGVNPNPQQLYNPFYTTYDTGGLSYRPIVPGNRLDRVTRPDGSPLVDPGAKKILDALWPLPNVPGAASNQTNFVGYSTPGIDNYTLDTRFDVRFTPNDLMFVTWSRSSGNSTSTGGLSPNNLYNLPLGNQAYLVTVNYVHTFNSDLTNEFIFGTGDGALITISPDLLSWYNSGSNPMNTLFKNTGAGITKGLMSVATKDYTYATPGVGEIFRAENQSWQVSDNVDWIHGPHSLSIGFNYFRKGEFDWDVQRNATFGGYSASGSNLGYIGGDDIADLVMGVPSNLWVRYNIQGGTPTAPDYNVTFPNWGFYGNDRYRVSPKLTISAGLRYDLSLPWYANNAKNGPCCAIYKSTGDGGVLEYPGIASGLPEHHLRAAKLDFAPRLGITYSVNPKTVIRSGYGIFYNTGSSQVSQNVGNAFYGTSATVNYNYNNTTLGKQIDTPYISLADIFPAPLTTALGTFPVSTGTGQGYVGDDQWTSIIYYDQQSMRLSYYQRMSFDVQRQIGTNDVFSISYAGAQGRKGWNVANLNLPAYRTGWVNGDGAVTPYNAARPNNVGRFGDIFVMRPTLNSFYNALIVEWRHSMANGLQFNSNYTWGKTVSDYPWNNTLNVNGSAGYNGSGVWSGFQYPNLYDRGEGTSSHRHRFVFSGIWAPVYGSTWPRALKATATGWRLSGILTMESGDALTVSNGGPGTPCSFDTSTAQCPTGYGSSAYDYAGFDELNVTGTPNIGHFKKTPYRQFNTSAFSIPPNNVRGNSGLGTVRGPGQNNVDLSLAKTFPIHERLHLEFRGDAFNALNHTQWTGINTVFPSGDSQFPFGMVNAAREARIGQVAAKLVF